jgi:sugar phosphate isomerase/epimerase
MQTGSLSDRRAFLRQLSLGSLALTSAGTAWDGRAAAPSRDAMRLCLTPGSIGVRANQTETIALAHTHGFEAVEPYADFLAGLSVVAMTELLEDLSAKGLVWGAAGFPVEFRRDDTAFSSSMQRLPGLADALQKAGVKRVGTWLSPGHSRLTYVENFRQHAQRLREAAKVLADHQLKLGLEYVGTFTSRARQRFPFVHNLPETRELIAEIGTGNVGYILDSWHWWQAGDTLDDLRTLRAEEIVSVDLNDAPVGVPKDQQQDGKRELPAATGVIETAPFLQVLAELGYNGPVRAEPFNQALNALENDAACAATIQAMKKAFEPLRRT